MFYNLKILPEAKINIQEAFDFYHRQNSENGKLFSTHLFETMDYLGNNPKLFAKKHRMIRETKISKFPFNIFYLVNDDTTEIIILAVLKIKGD